MMSQGPQQTPVGVIKASQGGFCAARPSPNILIPYSNSLLKFWEGDQSTQLTEKRKVHLSGSFSLLLLYINLFFAKPKPRPLDYLK
jgi:hypothetical protein